MISRDRIVPAACAVLAAGCIAGLTRIVAALGKQIPLDPNEGWNAYHAQSAMSGGVLYPGQGSFLFNNYPPVSFYVVGTLGRVVGDQIVAGRIVSLLALAGIGAGVLAALRRMNVGVWDATFSLLFLVGGLLVFSDYVGMDDPQLLGHGVAIAGLVLLLREPRGVVTVSVAALLMALAFFVKHNLIALPLAGAIWLAIYDRRDAIAFAVSGGAFGLAGLAIFHAIYGTGLLAQLASPRLYSLPVLADGVRLWLVWGGAPILCAAMLFGLRRDDPNVVLCGLYVLVSVVAGTVFGGGAGVDANIWFDAAIALSLSAGLALDRLKRATAAWVLAFALPLLAGLAVAFDSAWLEPDFWLYPFAEEAGSTGHDIAFLEAHRGPALCETMSLCYWAGKRAEVDVFNLGQAYEAHARDEGDLIRLIQARRYRVAEFDSLTDFALGSRVRGAFERYYRIDHADENGVFLVPR